MIITITEVTQEFTKTGAGYRKVKGITEGRETTKSVFDNLKDSWGLLKENTTLDFSLEKKGQFWNVIEIKPVTLPPPTTPKVLPEHQAIIEHAREGIRQSSPEEIRIRSMAVAYAKDLVVADKIKLDQLRVYADKFLDYIEGKEVQPVRRSLVEEAKKLGAKEIEEGE